MHYGTSSSWERQDGARCPSSHTAIASFDRGALGLQRLCQVAAPAQPRLCNISGAQRGREAMSGHYAEAFRIDAPFVLDGPVNGEAFRAYVEQFLVPTLRPGDMVAMDNLGSHEGQAVRQAIRSAKAHLLFLPPYSPDPNPIEQVFSKPKHMLRNAAERTMEETWRRIGKLLDRFTREACANYLAKTTLPMPVTLQPNLISLKISGLGRSRPLFAACAATGVGPGAPSARATAGCFPTTGPRGQALSRSAVTPCRVRPPYFHCSQNTQIRTAPQALCIVLGSTEFTNTRRDASWNPKSPLGRDQSAKACTFPKNQSVSTFRHHADEHIANNGRPHRCNIPLARRISPPGFARETYPQAGTL